MSQVNSIILVTTAVVAGIIGAVSLYFINDIRNGQHSHRTRDGEQNLRLELTSLQEELETLREQYKKSQEKNKEKRKKRRGPRSVVSFGSDLDFKSVAETEFDSSSEEYFDFSTDAGDDDDDDITLTEDVPQNGEMKKKKDPLAKSLEEIDARLFDGADEDMKGAYEILITLYNSRDILSDSKYAEVLWRLSKYCQRMANSFKKNNDNERRKDIIYEGIEYGEKAITLDPDNYNTHKWYAILVGMRNEYQGTSDKIKDGQIFYEHTNIALQLNPSDGSLYHLRGRFIVEIASLSWFEKKAASALFGELPPVTYDDAISDFKKAEELHDVPWKENKLLLAECYIAKGLYREGVTWLKNCESIPNRTSDDEVVSIKLEELLKKYSSYARS